MPVDLGVGVSAQPDVYLAGQEAAREAVSHLGGAYPDLTLVFSSVRYADPRLLKGINSMTAGCSLIGCTDAGGISTAGPVRRSVVAVALKARGGRFQTGVGYAVSKNARQAGQDLAQSLSRQGAQQAKALLALPDGLAGNGSAWLRGVQSILGESLPIVGGCAADDFAFEKTFQFFNDEILQDSIPAALFCGDIEVGIGVQHGWIPLGRPRRVTKASGPVIYELDRRPAVALYEEYLGVKKDELTEEPLAHVAMTYPLGTVVPRQAEYLLRHAIRVGENESIVCTAETQEGSWVRLMIGSNESALEAAKKAASRAMRQVSPVRLKGALVFCGVARQKMLGSDFRGEIDVVRDSLGGTGVRIGGFYSYGELAPWELTSGGQAKRSNMVHNESIVVMALG